MEVVMHSDGINPPPPIPIQPQNIQRRRRRKSNMTVNVFGAITVALVVRQVAVEAAGWPRSDDPVSDDTKLHLWSRGAFDLDDGIPVDQFLRLGPVSQVRQASLNHRASPYCDVNGYCSIRGGSQAGIDEARIEELGTRFGPEFLEAIERNRMEHAKDCEASCELYYCSNSSHPLVPREELLGETVIKSYTMGSVPPEDFADSFGFPLDIIKVTENVPLFSAEEAADVVAIAVAEGVDNNEFQSGKYQLAGDWLDNLPKTREWFNSRLESTFFPLLAHLFPEVISSPSVIRAHSVSLLKYNSSHPRTDVHIDNGVLAMTLAMTPKKEYVGGGTFFEHMGLSNILEMDVGHGTFRPGSVRHGGNRVHNGTRYILGAFLLLEDRVEHVRRLKNRGSELRRAQNFPEAVKHFEWALAMNPKCTTCLKDWGEILHRQNKFDEAEEKIIQALDLLEYKDSDALFSLGVVLSELGRDAESIVAYQKSIALNAEDAELCYNLGVKFGERGNTKDEMIMYAKATKANPKFGGAWLNWGTALAEGGNLDDVGVTPCSLRCLNAYSHNQNLHRR
jgi:tetratricopeptide (TPR) repeat protein